VDSRGSRPKLARETPWIFTHSVSGVYCVVVVKLDALAVDHGEAWARHVGAMDTVCSFADRSGLPLQERVGRRMRMVRVTMVVRREEARLHRGRGWSLGDVLTVSVA
jgi:hypothetical protein